MHLPTLFFVSAVATVSAKTININVGQGGLVFEPNITKAEKGDIVQFTFFKGNHNVVEGEYDMPCQTGSGNKFYSGFFPQVGSDGMANQTFNIPINNTDPIFYYCSHTHHCQLGMVGVINPPSSPPDALSTYASKASNLSQAMVNTPSAIAGGTFQRLSGAASTVSGGSGGSGSATSSMRASGTGASATATRTHGNSSSSGAGSAVHAGLGVISGGVLAVLAAVL